MSKVWKDGSMVRAKQSGKMKARVKGNIVDDWVVFSKGSLGRIVEVVREGRNRVGRVSRKHNIYLVRFATGVAELSESHLERVSGDSDTTLSREAMNVADPDLIVEESPVESEPGY